VTRASGVCRIDRSQLLRMRAAPGCVWLSRSAAVASTRIAMAVLLSFFAS